MKKILTAICAATLLMTGCGGGTAEEKPVELHVSAAASLTNVFSTSGRAARCNKLSKTAATQIYFTPPRKSK